MEKNNKTSPKNITIQGWNFLENPVEFQLGKILESRINIINATKAQLTALRQGACAHEIQRCPTIPHHHFSPVEPKLVVTPADVDGKWWFIDH